MQKLIKDKQIIDNEWTIVEKNEATDITPASNSIIPVNVWLAQKDQLRSRSDIGIWLDSDDDLEAIATDIKQFPIIGINFPAFADGRNFSNARLLRERYNFSGELRAIGNFIRDQLCYLRRCGVNAFQFADTSVDLEKALTSLDDFDEYYQAAVDQPSPLFRRR